MKDQNSNAKQESLCCSFDLKCDLINTNKISTATIHQLKMQDHRSKSHSMNISCVTHTPHTHTHTQHSW